MKTWGTLPAGETVELYTLTNTKGAVAEITTYGGIVVSLTMPDKNGNYEDVVLGYDSLDNYVANNPYFGALIGRYGNRIGDAQFTLNGTTYNLLKNDGENSLHGGEVGYGDRLWQAEPMETEKGPALILALTDKDGTQGYPGTVNIEVIYTLTNDNTLRLDYTATTDAPTVVNPTHHSYFNLTGDPTNTILDHELMIDADHFTPTDAGLIPTGELADVSGTPFDFRESHRIGARIDADNEQLKRGGGYDHNWALNNWDSSLKLVATLHDPASGRAMDLITTEPGLQFYSGNFLDGTLTGKNGIVYNYRTGLCLEAQHFPDSPNIPEFPTTVLNPGETYKQTTIHKFYTK